MAEKYTTTQYKSTEFGPALQLSEDGKLIALFFGANAMTYANILKGILENKEQICEVKWGPQWLVSALTPLVKR